MGDGTGTVAQVVIDPAFWGGKRVLVLGHTGFKGSWLSLWLESLGAEVTGFSDGVPPSPSLYELARVGDTVAHVAGDVRDFGALGDAVRTYSPEIVFHLAAQPLVRRSFAEPRETFETNVMGTVNVLEAVRAASGVAVVVNVTSDKCYENREWEWGYREYEAMGGLDPYSGSKGCSELVTQSYRRSFFADPGAARIASARAGNVVGGGDWAEDRLIPDIVRAALADTSIRVRNPGSIRPWQHVMNALSGYLMLAQAAHADPDDAGPWNFGPADEDARSVQWIIERLASAWPGGIRWQADPGPHPPESHYLKLDSSKARSRLGWSPRWDLEEALDRIVAWYSAFRDGEDMRAATLSQIESFGRVTTL